MLIINQPIDKSSAEINPFSSSSLVGRHAFLVSLTVSFVYRTIKYQYEPVNKNNTLRDKGHIKQFKGLCYCHAVFPGYSLYIPYIIPERLKQLHAMKRVGRVNEHIIILSENIGLSYPEYRQRGVGGSKRAVAEGNAAVFLNER